MSPAPPLAERMRPQRIDDIVGQSHLLAEGAPLRTLLAAERVPSMILWGPPGVGKTTLARVMAQHGRARFMTLSAVMAGVKDIREAVAQARAAASGLAPEATILFIDEIHRFNKSQQDALLPYVEDGTLTLIGATTENPSFELNSALLSRVRVFVLRALEHADLQALLRRALSDGERGLGAAVDALPAHWLERIVATADGDARRALVLLETVFEYVRAAGQCDDAALDKLIGRGLRRFDKQGEQFYDQISALHKSVRSSDPDAAVYWLARMLDGGCDPHYLARRLLRMAIEDIGLADPRAQQLCLEAWQIFDRLGSPEGDLALAQAAIYLACAPKSNAGYAAWNAARATVEQTGTLEVPMHLRNAPTLLMKQLGYGSGYRYDHDEADGVALGQQCLPQALLGTQFYQPVPRGMEIRIGEKLAELRTRRAQAADGENTTEKRR